VLSSDLLGIRVAAHQRAVVAWVCCATRARSRP